MLLLKLSDKQFFCLSDEIMAVLSSATLLFFLIFIDIGRLFMHIRYCNVFCIFILLKVADMLIP